MKRFSVIFMTTVMAAGLLAGCGSAKSGNTASSAAAASVSSVAAVSSSSASSASSAATSSASAASSDDKKAANEAQGVVIDASMNQVTIQTTDGKTQTYMLDDSSDTSGLSNGLLLGNGIDITFSGDDDSLTLVSAKDVATKANDADALAAAGEVIMAVESKNLDSLEEMCAYPVYVGIGDGKTIKSKDDFTSAYKAEDIFTDALVSSVTETNLMDAEITKAGLIISKDGAAPDIILSKDKDQWQITGINY
ncbi:MAG: hypothetical protein LKF52_09680 [Butyrivibrio sp.]|nr:hypothetical protein [Butyrivibrio sp.]